MTRHSYEQMKRAGYFKWTGDLAARGMARKAAMGEYPSAAPLGYVNVREGGSSRLVIDPEVAPLIRLVFEHQKQGISVRKSLKILTEQGLRSKRGNVLTPSAVWRILHSPIYAGTVLWKGRCIKGSHSPIKLTH